MFKNMKIGRKLVTAFIIVAVISSISGVLGSFLLAKSDKDYSSALENYGFSQGKIGKLGMEINKGTAIIRDIVFMSDQASLDEAYAKMQEIKINADAQLEEVRSTNTSTEAKTLFAKIEDELAKYRVERDKVIELGMANRSIEAQAAWTNNAMPIADQIEVDIDQLLEMNVTVGTTVSSDLSALGQTMLFVMIAAIIIGLAIAVVFAVYIARSISKPVIMVEAAALKMSKGDYDIDLPFRSKDEIGSLAHCMRVMISVTREIITDTSRGLSEIARGNFDIVPKAEYIGIYDGIKQSMSNITTSLSDTLYVLVH